MTIENYSTSYQRTICCRILGLEPFATREEIKSAYKRLALKWHPDRQKSQKEYAKDRFIEIHEAYQTLMNLTPMSPPMSGNTSSFTSPPPTPASRPFDFYSQSTGSTSSWASSPSSSNASTPRTSTDELPTPKANKHTRTHAKTSTDGFRRTRTRTLSRVKKSDRAQFTRTESSNSNRSHNSSKSHHSSSHHHHSSRSHKPDRSEPSSSDRSRSSSDKGKERSSSSKHSHPQSERSDRSDRDDHHRRHRSHRHHSHSRSRSRDRFKRAESSRHPDKEKERERGTGKDAKVDEPEMKREKAEKRPTNPHKKSDTEKMEKVEEEADDPPPQTSEPPLRPPIIGIPLRPSRAPDTNNSDWIFPLPLTLEELYSGANYRFQITRQLRTPPNPESHPTSTPKSAHSSLDGETSASTIHVNVDIPPGGYKNQTQMRFEGIGNQRKSDGTFQDIVFVIQEVLHDRFIRIQDDLVARIELTWDEDLQKEDVILVDGLDGERVEVPIPKVPDDSKETRMPKAGMPTRNSKDEVVGRGDLVIRWEFVFPQKQSSSKWRALKSKFNWQSPKTSAP